MVAYNYDNSIGPHLKKKQIMLAKLGHQEYWWPGPSFGKLKKKLIIYIDWANQRYAQNIARYFTVN